MFLRSYENYDQKLTECIDYLDIEDKFTDGRNELRGRYCGEFKNLTILSRTNDVTVLFAIGELTSTMPKEIGFQMMYELKGTDIPNIFALLYLIWKLLIQ